MNLAVNSYIEIGPKNGAHVKKGNLEWKTLRITDEGRVEEE